jgi:GntR family transcriptional repressor for pyruvate dehydrogenase complex
VGAVEQALRINDGNEADNNLYPRILDSLVDEQMKEENFVRLGALDAQFHEQLVAMSHNPILATLYRMIHKIVLQGTSEVIRYPPSRDIVLRDHREIARTFINKDTHACIQAICEHLKTTESLIEEYLQEED